MIKGLNHSEEGVKTTHDDKEESVHQYSPNDSSNAETEGNTQLPQKHFMGVLSTTPEFGNTIRETERKD